MINKKVETATKSAWMDTNKLKGGRNKAYEATPEMRLHLYEVDLRSTTSVSVSKR